MCLLYCSNIDKNAVYVCQRIFLIEFLYKLQTFTAAAVAADLALLL